jgi:Tfp pilus assembly protein PilN
VRAVNLLPRDASRQSRITSDSLPALVGAGTGLAVVATLAGGYLLQSSKVSDAQQQLDVARAQLASTPLPPPAPKLPPAPVTPAVVTNEQQPRLQALSAALSQRIAWDRILREFSLVLPSDVWLTALQMSSPTANGGTSGGSGLTLSGTTYSYDSVARLLARLSLIPDLSGVALTSTANNGRLVQFNLGATIKGAPAPAAPATPTPPVTTDTTQTTTTSGSGA